MTYLGYHILFNLPILLLLMWLGRRRITGEHLKWIGLVSIIVVLFTFPWDSVAVSRGIWGFDRERVLLFIGNLPVEEVLFFLFETLVVSFLVILFLPKPETSHG